VVSGKDLVLVVVPSHVMRETSEKFSPHIPENTLVVSASKGIENITHLTMSQVLKETIPHVAENDLQCFPGLVLQKKLPKRYPH
jgi:glycerol-3-phosphate dehydrogenase (NAD(P)+)